MKRVEISVLPGLSGAAERVDIEPVEYRENCLNCQDEAGDGNGSYALVLNKSASDLSKLVRNNQGVFPFARGYEVIDGREIVKGHGGRDMLIWGNAYRTIAGQRYFDLPYHPEIFVGSRILVLSEYISRR